MKVHSYNDRLASIFMSNQGNYHFNFLITIGFTSTFIFTFTDLFTFIDILKTIGIVDREKERLRLHIIGFDSVPEGLVSWCCQKFHKIGYWSLFCINQRTGKAGSIGSGMHDRCQLGRITARRRGPWSHRHREGQRRQWALQIGAEEGDLLSCCCL